MKIARVIGTVVSTISSPRLPGVKMLMLTETDPQGQPIGKPFAAIDLVDAGEGDLVLTCHGSAARQTPITKETPTDAVVMAVLDQLEVDGDVVYRQG